MQEFKVGDRIRIKEDCSSFYEKNAVGTVIYAEDDVNIKVKFDSGEYNLSNEGSWWVNPARAELVKKVKEKEMKAKKSEGYGNFAEGDSYVVTNGWAVEVNGKIDTIHIYPSRSLSREIRKDYAEAGDKAHVRRVEIKVLKHKV